MKKRLTFITALTLVCTFIFGCKKDKEEPIGILTSKTWKRTTVDKNPSTNPLGYFLYAPIIDCNGDDIYKFSPDGTYTLDPGGNRCGDEEIRVDKYDAVNKEIYINGNKFQICEISRNQIKFLAPIDGRTGSLSAIFLLD